jgi:hypothetical protein
LVVQVPAQTIFVTSPFAIRCSLFTFLRSQPGLQIGEGIVRGHGSLTVGVSTPDCFIGHAGVFVFMAIDTEQLPVAAIERIVVVIVVLVMHGQLAQTDTGEFTSAPAANPRKQFERPITIRCLSLTAVPTCVGNHAIEACLVGDGRFGHGCLISGATGRNETMVPVADCATGTEVPYCDSNMDFRLSRPARYAPSMKPMTSSSFILPSELFLNELRHRIVV